MEEEIKKLNIVLKSLTDENEYLKNEVKVKDVQIANLEYTILSLKEDYEYLLAYETYDDE